MGVALGARAKLAGGAAHQRARSHGLARGVAAALESMWQRRAPARRCFVAAMGLGLPHAAQRAAARRAFCPDGAVGLRGVRARKRATSRAIIAR